MSKKVMKILKHKADPQQKEEGKRVMSLLASLPKTNPFTVPDHYFDQLPARIMQKVSEQAGSGRNLIRTIIEMRWPYKLAMAASVIFIVFIAYYLAFTPQSTQPLFSDLQQITAGELIEYDGYLVDLDESLVDEWIEQQGDDVDAELVDLTSLDELSETDIMNYLLVEYSPDELTLASLNY